MIVGIGTDLVEIERVVKACQKESFLNKVFTLKEIELGKTNSQKYASNFAVKEAISKMFGTGFAGIRPIDIEVLRDEHGKPYVNLYGTALERSKMMGISNIFVSITNTKGYASAYVIGEKKA